MIGAPTVRSPLVGGVLCVAAVGLFAGLDALGKHLAQTYPVPLLAWIRYSVHFLIMLALAAPSLRGQLLRTERPLLNLTRGFTLVAVTLCAMTAFRTLPLGETTALLYVSPLLVTLLAGPLLGESVQLRHYFSAGLGFMGMLIIVRPESELTGHGFVYAMGAAIFFAAYQLLTRQLAAAGEHPLRLLFYVAMTGTLALTASLPWIWVSPLPPVSMEAIAGAIGLGLLGGVGHLLLIRAFWHAPAALLSPLMYVQIIWATLLGFLFFDRLPDSTSLGGMLIIMSAGALLVWLDRRAAGARIRA